MVSTSNWLVTFLHLSDLNPISAQSSCNPNRYKNIAGDIDLHAVVNLSVQVFLFTLTGVDSNDPGFFWDHKQYLILTGIQGCIW